MATLLLLGRYEAIRLLGEGGAGRVFLCRDHNLARPVVVKVLHSHIANQPMFRERFDAEALQMAQFEHPHAVRVYDVGWDSLEGPCIVMEYVRGPTFAELLKKNRGHINPARLYRLLAQLSEVLQAAHDQGIVHRNLKPANLMILDPDSPSEKIKVVDLGLAKICQTGTSEAGASETGIGTPAYMAPEQVQGLTLDQRTDIYSVGVIMYESLTGRVPFIGRPADVLRAHVEQEPPAFADIGDIGTIPWSVEDAVRACLAKDPADRPANAVEMLTQYKAALFGEGQLLAPKKPPAPVEQPAKTDTPPIKIDPNAVVFHMQASITRAVAEYKLKGFVSDAGGEVMESVPGMIRVRLGQSDGLYQMSAGALSWLGFGRDAGLVEVYLYLRQEDPRRPDVQTITVLMISLKQYTPQDSSFLAHCKRIYSDLRGYLMGHDVNKAT